MDEEVTSRLNSMKQDQLKTVSELRMLQGDKTTEKGFLRLDLRMDDIDAKLDEKDTDEISKRLKKLQMAHDNLQCMVCERFDRTSS